MAITYTQAIELTFLGISVRWNHVKGATECQETVFSINMNICSL